jgi:hypothetical protein
MLKIAHTSQKDAQHISIQLQAFYMCTKGSIQTFLKYPQNINPTINGSYCSRLCNNVAGAGLYVFAETTIHCFFLKKHMCSHMHAYMRHVQKSKCSNTATCSTKPLCNPHMTTQGYALRLTSGSRHR